jgi:hypothetical protein
VLLPERRGTSPSVYKFLVGLHQQKYTYQSVDGALLGSGIRALYEWPTMQGLMCRQALRVFDR